MILNRQGLQKELRKLQFIESQIFTKNSKLEKEL